MRWMGRLLLVLLVAAGAVRGPTAADPPRVVVVTSNGWHTGIVIARADLPPNALPEIADFPKAAYFEFGWGDRVYYPAPRKDVAMTLGAALPGPAIMHVIAFDGDPSGAVPGTERVRLVINDAQFRKLVAFIDSGFERQGAPRAQASSKGLYPQSLFYPATGSFHIFNTCNTWIARGLAAAGLPVRVSGVQRADDVMEQVRALARPR